MNKVPMHYFMDREIEVKESRMNYTDKGWKWDKT